MEREQVLFRLFGRFCPEGTILYTEGSPGEEAFLLQGGRLRMTPAAGPPRELAPGDVLGEEAFFERAPRTARVEARADSRLLHVGERTLESFCRNGPAAAGQLLMALAGGAAAARHALEAWALFRALRRAEPLLAEAAERAVPRGEFLEHGGGGDAVRLLEALAAAGAVAVAEGEVRVRDRDALAREGRRIAALAGEGEG